MRKKQVQPQHLLDRADLDAMLAKEERKPISFIVVYLDCANGRKAVVYDDAKHIRWKNGVLRCTVKFEDIYWMWQNGDAIKVDKKRVKK